MRFSKWIFGAICLMTTNLQAGNLPPQLPVDFINLSKQDRALIRDLKLLSYPPQEWKIDFDDHEESSSPCYDVVIIGAGMAGLSAGAALYREGIFNIKIFDQNSPGCEGPWMNYARMKTLRTPKDLVGPALDIPHLTFHAWFEAQWGQEAWKALGKIPTAQWMDYLAWYGKAMQLPIENNWKLVSIIPGPGCFELELEQPEGRQIVKARKVVLATGRDGFGGSNIPSFVKQLPSSAYAHTCDPIDFQPLKGRKIAVIGVGASGFDAAACALEAGAARIDMIMRRSRLPNVSKLSNLYYKSFAHGFYHLSDHARWEFMAAAFEPGIPPPIEALERLHKLENFHLCPNTTITRASWENSQVILETNQGKLVYDFLILGTGFNIDGNQQPELRPLMPEIALWEDHVPAEWQKANPTLGRFPYLGSTFEFLPKIPGTASYLKNLYCFNHASTMSHALLSSDIPAVSIGARRLAEGIATDFFIQDAEKYLQNLKDFSNPDFNPDDFFN